MTTKPTGAIALEDGTIFWGHGHGAAGVAAGELCFNTAMTGYQEILTDPSYARQLVTLTYPHIGNTGTNAEDIEKIVALFKERDERALIESHSYYDDESQLIQTTKQVAEELKAVAASCIRTRVVADRLWSIYRIETGLKSALGWGGAGDKLAFESEAVSYRCRIDLAEEC